MPYRKTVTSWTVRLLLMVTLVALAACGGPGAPATDPTQAGAQQASGSITLYTSESEDKVNEMVADFNRQVPNVQVNIFRSGTGEVTAKLQAEEQAGDILADMIWFADIDYFAGLAEKDLLLEYAPVGGDQVPAEFHYNRNRYHEVRLIFNVVAYNTQLVQTPPTGWRDLLDPAYTDKVGMPSALYSGAAFGQVGTFAGNPEFGWEFWEALAANGVGVDQGNGAVANKLASGEYVIAQLVDFFARDLKASGSPIDHIWPEDGAVLIPTPIGILKDTQNPAAAQAFLDYMYTESAQRLFVQQSYVAILPGMPTPAGAPNLADLVIVPVNVEYINANRQEIRQKFIALFGEG
jgi:iron(III) transport system substrate-binding protein